MSWREKSAEKGASGAGRPSGRGSKGYRETEREREKKGKCVCATPDRESETDKGENNLQGEGNLSEGEKVKV